MAKAFLLRRLSLFHSDFMLRVLIFLFFVLFSTPLTALENQFSFLTEAKDLKHTYSGKINKIIDGQTLLLTNGKIIRLTGIDLPVHKTNPDFDFSFQAKEFLEDTLLSKSSGAGRDIMVYQTRKAEKGRINRMNHDLGHILVKSLKTETGDKSQIWLQGALIDKGLARVYTSPTNPQLSAVMLEQETKARSSSIGLWAKDSPFALITPDQAADHLGDFVVLQGRVVNAASVKNNLYLNFGDNWRNDFTVMIDTAQRKKLSQQSISPTSLSNKTIRVRGWLREYNGPLIELEDINHLEIIQ